MKSLYIVDAMALIYRSHFAFLKNPRITSSGKNVSPIFGFLNSILEIIQKQKPDYIAIAWDTPEPTFRHTKYDQYKATRQSQPEDISESIPNIKEILNEFNISSLSKPGYEADDIIGSISKKCKSKANIYIISPDKDLAQLIEKGIFLVRPAYMSRKTEILASQDINEKWQINNPKQIIDLLALQGDTSDNIPGVVGIGAKTSQKLIRQYHNLEGIYQNIDQITGKIKNNLIKDKKNAFLSKDLVTIRQDLDIKCELENLIFKQPNFFKLIKLLKNLEFNSIISRLSKIYNINKEVYQNSIFDLKQNIEIKKSKYIIKKFTDLPDVISDTDQIHQIFIYLRPFQKESKIIKGSFFLSQQNLAFDLEIDIENKNQETQIFLKILASQKIKKIGYKIKKLILWLKKHNCELKGNLFDVAVGYHLLHSEEAPTLDIMKKKYLKIEYNQEFDKNNIKYILENSWSLSQIYLILEDLIKKTSLKHYSSDIEMPLIYTLAQIEYNGVKIDTSALQSMSKIMDIQLKEIKQKIYDISETEFNLDSPKQLGEILFDKLKLAENPTKTKSGQYATGEKILINLAKDHKIAQIILKHRELSKLKSTYVDALPKLVEADGKIHTSYNQAIVTTGRLSSTNPNLQNIPIKTPDGRLIRKAFIPSNDDYEILSADYSQIELRLAASFANDKAMIDAFKRDEDIHLEAASKIFNISKDKVTKVLRNQAKVVNFSILYGVSSFGLAQNLKIKKKEAAEIIEAYFNSFPQIKEYIAKIIEEAKKNGYVKTLLGRRRYLPNINSRNAFLRGYEERNAINSPLQGTNAEMIKIAMNNIQDFIYQNKLKSKLIMQVHDELVLDLYKFEKDILSPKVEFYMSRAVNLNVPIKVNIVYGRNWLEMN